jgi:hypothetical protein
MAFPLFRDEFAVGFGVGFYHGVAPIAEDVHFDFSFRLESGRSYPFLDVPGLRGRAMRASGSLHLRSRYFGNVGLQVRTLSCWIGLAKPDPGLFSRTAPGISSSDRSVLISLRPAVACWPARKRYFSSTTR